jgi:hypothetical protein
VSFLYESTGWNLVETIQGTGSPVQFIDKREAIFERQYYRVKVD